MKEKPNEWITVADRMAGVVAVIMLLFVIAAMHVANKNEGAAISKAQRTEDTGSWLGDAAASVGTIPGVSLHEQVVDLGPYGRFGKDSWHLSPANADRIREVALKLLSASQTDLGKKWLKSFVIVGYADEEGDYLFNLNLSLERSQRMLCELIAPSPGGRVTLDSKARAAVRDLFLVSGYSFNALKDTRADSRRVEFRIEFRQIDEPIVSRHTEQSLNPGQCRI